MYAGRIVERAPAEALFAAPLHPYTQGLIATLPDPARRVGRLPVIPGGVPDIDQRQRLPLRRPLPAGRGRLPGRGAGARGNWRPATSSPASGPGHERHIGTDRARWASACSSTSAAAACSAASGGCCSAAQDVSFAIAEGETLGLVGESGSGKSTLGNVVAGLQEPTAGTLRFHGRAMDRAARREARRSIQIVFQDPFSALDPRMPVSDIIAEPLRIQGIGSGAERRARAGELVGAGRAAARRAEPLPARVLRRPAPAHRHRPRARPGAGADRRRRAALRARRLDPEPDPQPDEGAAGAPRAVLSVHQPRPRRGAPPGGPGGGALPRAGWWRLAPRAPTCSPGRRTPTPRRCSSRVPRIGQRRQRREAIRGEMPSPLAPPPGCVFHPRCPKAQAICRVEVPRLAPAPGRPAQLAACHFKD